MIDLLPMIGGMAGLAGLVGVILQHFKSKPKHPVDVRAEQVRIHTDEIKNDNLVIAQLEEGYERLKNQYDDVEKKVNECQEQHREAKEEAKKQRQESKQAREQLQKIMSRCKLNCLVD